MNRLAQIKTRVEIIQRGPEALCGRGQRLLFAIRAITVEPGADETGHLHGGIQTLLVRSAQRLLQPWRDARDYPFLAEGFGKARLDDPLGMSGDQLALSDGSDEERGQLAEDLATGRLHGIEVGVVGP